MKMFLDEQLSITAPINRKADLSGNENIKLFFPGCAYMHWKTDQRKSGSIIYLDHKCMRFTQSS